MVGLGESEPQVSTPDELPGGSRRMLLAWRAGKSYTGVDACRREGRPQVPFRMGA